MKKFSEFIKEDEAGPTSGVADMATTGLQSKNPPVGKRKDLEEVLENPGEEDNLKGAPFKNEQ